MRYWKRTKVDGTTSVVESYSHDLDVEGAIEIDKEEYDEFLASLPPIELEPPHSTHIAIIDAIDITKARPVRVKRVWEGEDYFYDCLATESIKDQYVAGDVVVGDYVIVHFDDIGELVVVAKVFKSW